MTPRPTVFAAMLLATALGGVPSIVDAEPQWFLMARHGECMDIAGLKRKVPELGAIDEPEAFMQQMRSQGLQVTANEITRDRGTAIEVTVPARELSLIFVTEELCLGQEAR